MSTATPGPTMQTNSDLYNGREAEVIAQFNDGYSYSKTKLDASLRELVHDHKSVKSVKGQVAVKKDDVDLIVKEFDISQAQAEKVLSENGGDLDRTLRALVAMIISEIVIEVMARLVYTSVNRDSDGIVTPTPPTMSIDLEWHKLDSSLSKTLVDILNRQLSNTPRPSFIGPVEITGLDFGTHAPDVELVDLRDIHRDFLEDDDSDGASEQDNVKVTERAQAAEEEDEEDEFEWVSRRAARRGLAEDALAYHHLPPHVRYGRGPAVDLFASTPALYPGSPRDMWGAGGTGMGAVPVQRNRSMPSLGDVRPAVVPRPSSGMYHPGPLTSSPMSGSAHESASSSVAVCHPTTRPVSPSPDASSDAPPEEQQARPDLQLHLHLNWHSNLRLTLTTSLLINYPSPSFMSLPIKLSVTGLVFNGEVAVAYEGSRERVHICILDELDPYGPACRRERSQSSTPSDIDDDTGGKREGKRLPVGQRLLPSIFIESEIGQADKHVLKNVTRVERFIQDVIRKTVEEELVFPNFHTLVMGDQSR